MKMGVKTRSDFSFFINTVVAHIDSGEKCQYFDSKIPREWMDEGEGTVGERQREEQGRETKKKSGREKFQIFWPLSRLVAR